MRNFKGKKVLVYGMGTSGQSACKLLHKKGACVSFYDDEDKFGSFFAFDKNPTLHKYDLVVLSPGIKMLGNEIISHFTLTRTPIISELDLAYFFCSGKIVGITGTNGKTTVTSMVYQILKESGKKVFSCGNIGLPFSSVCEEGGKDSIYVCEVSNFQLESCNFFHANLACVLNIAPDHIDRHGTYQEYIAVKRKIIAKHHQKVVLNFDDEVARSFKISKKVLYFSKKMLSRGVFVKNNAVYFNKTKIISCSDIPFFGLKNLENVMAAVAICVKLKVKAKVIRQGILSYKLPPHRLEYVGQTKGAHVFDDSKATNISSVQMAVEALGGQRLVLLMGGQNKNINFDDFFSKKYEFEKLYCFGEAGEEIYNCAKRFGYNPQLFKTMKACVHFVRDHLEEGQVILLSPGCASFDEFASYAVRGEVFKEIMFDCYEKIEY